MWGSDILSHSFCNIPSQREKQDNVPLSMLATRRYFSDSLTQKFRGPFLPKPAYGPASGSRDFPKRTPRSYSLLSWKSTTTHHLSKRGHRLQYFLPYLRKAVGDRATSRIPSSHQSGRTSDGFPPLRQHREAEPWDGTPCDAVLRLAGRQSFHGA